MQQYSKEEKITHLSCLYWDLEIDSEQLYGLLEGEIEETPLVSRSNLYCRLLKTYGWYKLLKLVPEEMLKDMLNDTVLSRLHPKDLRDRFIYARQVLSR